MLQINSLENAIRLLYKCEPTYLKTVFVDEKFHGQTMWQGDVEVFEVTGIPRVTHCYVIDVKGRDGEFNPVFLLNQWPVTSPQTAVQTMITLGVLKQPGDKSVSAFKRLDATPSAQN